MPPLMWQYMFILYETFNLVGWNKHVDRIAGWICVNIQRRQNVADIGDVIWWLMF